LDIINSSICQIINSWHVVVAVYLVFAMIEVRNEILNYQKLKLRIFLKITFLTKKNFKNWSILIA